MEELHHASEEVYVDELIQRWVIDVVRATRELETVAIGASVRGSLALERAARAWALLHDRDYVIPGGRRGALPPGRRPQDPVHADLPRRDPQARPATQAAARFVEQCFEVAPRPEAALSGEVLPIAGERGD